MALAKFDAARKRVNTGKHGRQIEALGASTTAMKTTGEDSNNMLKEAMPIIRKMDDTNEKVQALTTKCDDLHRIFCSKPFNEGDPVQSDAQAFEERQRILALTNGNQQRLRELRAPAKRHEYAVSGRIAPQPRAINYVKVKSGDGSAAEFQYQADWTVGQLVAQTRIKLGITDDNGVILKLGKKLLESEADRLDTHFKDRVTLTVQVQPPLTSITVKQHGKDPFTLDATEADTIDNVKVKVQETAGTPVDQQSLKFGKVVLEDSHTLSDYKIPNGAALTLTKAKAKPTPRHGINAGDVD